MFCFFFERSVEMSDVTTKKKPATTKRTPVDDEMFAVEWTKIISNGGTVQDVADALGLSKEYTQQRSVQLRKELKNYDVDLPKAKGRQRRKKSLDTVAAALQSLMTEIDELDNSAQG